MMVSAVSNTIVFSFLLRLILLLPILQVSNGLSFASIAETTAFRCPLCARKDAVGPPPSSVDDDNRLVAVPSNEDSRASSSAAAKASSLKCPAGHTFDLSSSGYVNLLPSGSVKRRKMATGDTASMLRARRQFLNEGHYTDLADVVCNEVVGHVGKIIERNKREEKEILSENENSSNSKNEEVAISAPSSSTSVQENADTTATNTAALSPRQRKLQAKRQKSKSEKAMKREREAAAAKKAVKAKEYAEYMAKIPSIVDLGCGEGWYSSRVVRAIAEDCNIAAKDGNNSDGGDNTIVARVAALDASKDAADMTARHLLKKDASTISTRISNRVQVNVAVADAKSTLPFADNSVNVVLSVFAPRDTSELYRILKPNGDGIVVIAQPSSRHLHELGQVEIEGVGLNFVSVEEQKKERVTDGMISAGFELSNRHTIESTMELSGEEVQSLVNMGPSGFHQDESSQKVLDMLVAEDIVTTTTKSFVVLVFEKI